MIVYKHTYSPHWEFGNSPRYEHYRQLLHEYMNEYLDAADWYASWKKRLVEEEKLEWIGLSSLAAHFHRFVMKKLDVLGPNITSSEREAIYWFTAGVDMDSIIYLLKEKIVIWRTDSADEGSCDDNMGIESLFVHLLSN
jgi:hypothetical protein